MACNVFAQAHGEKAFGFVVNLRAQNFTELDGLALGVWQFKSHQVFTRNGFNHADGHQAERPRQVLGQADHLRAFDPCGGLNLIAGNHWARCGSHHTHIDAKVLEFFLDQARGHLQRFWGHAFLL